MGIGTIQIEKGKLGPHAPDSRSHKHSRDLNSVDLLMIVAPHLHQRGCSQDFSLVLGSKQHLEGPGCAADSDDHDSGSAFCGHHGYLSGLVPTHCNVSLYCHRSDEGG